MWAVAALLEVVLTFADLAGTPLTSPGPRRAAGVLHLEPRRPGSCSSVPWWPSSWRSAPGSPRGERPWPGSRRPPSGRRGPGAHGSRRRLRQPRGCRQRARRAPPRGRRLDRRPPRPRGHAPSLGEDLGRHGSLLHRRHVVLRRGGRDRPAAGLDPARVPRRAARAYGTVVALKALPWSCSGSSAGGTDATSPTAWCGRRATDGCSPAWLSVTWWSWVPRPGSRRSCRAASPRAGGGAGPQPRPRADRLPRSRSDGDDWAHRVAARLAVPRHGGPRRGAIPRRRPPPAPPGRRLAGAAHGRWVLGWALFVWATCGAPDLGAGAFSVHMVMHMVVAMLVPLLLVPGAPVTLALRTLKARPDKTWGPRELLLQVVHSRAMRVLSNSSSQRRSSSSASRRSTGRVCSSLTDDPHGPPPDDGPLPAHRVPVRLGAHRHRPRGRWSPLMLLVILFATISFHAFFGVALTSSESLLAPDFFAQVNLPNWTSADWWAPGRRDRVGRRGGSDARPGRDGRRAVVPPRRAGDPAQGPPGRP